MPTPCGPRTRKSLKQERLKQSSAVLELESEIARALKQKINVSSARYASSPVGSKFCLDYGELNKNSQIRSIMSLPKHRGVKLVNHQLHEMTDEKSDAKIRRSPRIAKRNLGESTAGMIKTLVHPERRSKSAGSGPNFHRLNNGENDSDGSSNRRSAVKKRRRRRTINPRDDIEILFESKRRSLSHNPGGRFTSREEPNQNQENIPHASSSRTTSSNKESGSGLSGLLDSAKKCKGRPILIPKTKSNGNATTQTPCSDFADKYAQTQATLWTYANANANPKRTTNSGSTNGDPKPTSTSVSTSTSEPVNPVTGETEFETYTFEQLVAGVNQYMQEGKAILRTIAGRLTSGKIELPVCTQPATEFGLTDDNGEVTFDINEILALCGFDVQIQLDDEVPETGIANDNSTQLAEQLPETAIGNVPTQLAAELL